MAPTISKPSPRLSKSPSQSQSSPRSISTPKSSSSSLSSHLAMVELKSRILSALSKLSDRDTHQIAVDDLEKIIRTLPSDGVPMLLNSLLHDPSPHTDTNSRQINIVGRRESIRLLALLCSFHPDHASAHLPKIIAHLVRRLKDPASDSSVRDACRDAAGSLAALYLRPSTAANPEDTSTAASGGGSSSPVVSLFVKPLFEAMGEQNKAVQAGAAMCLAKVVECAGGGGHGEGRRSAMGGAAFQRLCPRICKLFGGQSFLAKGALLSVVSSLAQVGALIPQNMQQVLQSVRECLENSDWATRKAAADTLSVLSSSPRHLIADGAAPTIAAIEACRFDKVKPVRDSMMEALLSWKKIAGKVEDGTSEDLKDGNNCESADTEEKSDNKRSNASNRRSEFVKDSSATSSPTNGDAFLKEKGSNIPEKAALLLKKRAPTLTNKELNPDFFQKLETRSSDDLPVEVVVPRRCHQSSHSQGEEGPELFDSDSRGTPRGASNHDGLACHELNDIQGRAHANYQNAEKRLGMYNKLLESDDSARDKWTEKRGFRVRDSKGRAFDIDDRVEVSQRDPSACVNIFRPDGHAEGSFMNNKGNWLAIQRQLSQLERQQANLMNMLQDFMGGSHDSLITLENRVRGLERVVEEMARDLAISLGRRGGNMMLGFEAFPGRSSSKHNGLHDYSSSKFGGGGDGWIPFAERYLSSGSIISGFRGRDPPWRSDSEQWDTCGYTTLRNGVMNSRRGTGAVAVDGRVPRTEQDSDQVANRRAWDKGQGPLRLGEGPSARSVWQASKDEATLEAIRVAGEDNGTSRVAKRTTILELDAEALTDDNLYFEDSWKSISSTSSISVDFMGGSHDSLITLENRVRGLERVVEEMARDLAISLGRRGGNMMLGFEAFPGRSSSKHNGLHDYSSSKFGGGGDGWIPFAERYLSSGSIISGFRGRDPPWRSDSEQWDTCGYTTLRNGVMNSRRGTGAVAVDGRVPRTEQDSDQVANRRAWDKGQGPLRLGEGPSARSVWQASKDEATLEAIRVAGEDNGTSRVAKRTTILELDAEALTDDNLGQERGPLWASWTRAMDSIHIGDMDSAYAEVLCTGDDLLLVKLMYKSGPVVDQLSSEIASEVLRMVGQFLMEQSLFDIALTWLQQRVAKRTTILELDAEALTDDNLGQERGPLWASWTRAMDSIHIGDMDSAYAEVLCTGDDLLLVKLMYKSGPVVDQLSSEIASEVLRMVGQFLMEQSLFDIALMWLQQLTDLVIENGADVLSIPIEGKREILLNLHQTSAIEPSEDWEGPTPDQIMMQLASSWGINLQQLIK
ncbi:putative Microtubule-associated protein TORTIFOLIA1 [Cocos nucifera]|uniref:Putative Microtubule-associated protein TORTIFOLIA1 n=1 Tax=Cocos nucifera TaxID=13894 RepID=A0A8K0IBS7_COCNU|nr:putative Microtubule-associated protein TORTIFOLIA1 [Cocos nucifera]